MSEEFDYSSKSLLQEEQILYLESMDVLDAANIGKIATEIAIERKLPIAIEVRIGDWVIYHVSLPGSTPENDWWI